MSTLLEKSDEGQEKAAPPANRVWDYALLAVIACGWIGCWLYAFSSFPGLNADEAYNAMIWELWWGGEVPSLRFPSGRYPHYPLSGAMALSVWAFGSSLWALRLPVLLSSLATVLLIVRFGWRRWGSIPSLMFALIFAVHPLFLGYSRFAWESSTAWFALSLVALPLLFIPPPERQARHWWSIGVGVVLVFLAHPVFVITLLAVLFVELWRAAENWQRGKALRNVMAFTVFLTLLGWLGFLSYNQLGLILHKIIWLWFVYLWELISGVSLYRFITGASWGTGFILQSIATLFSVAMAAWWLRRKAPQRLGWILGVLGLSALGYLLILAGPTTKINRYGLPLVYLTSMLLVAGAAVASRRQRLFLFALYTTCSLGTYTSLYFVRGFQTQNRQAHYTFWSGSHLGDREPKQKAAHWLQTTLKPQTQVMTHSFFLQYGVRFYLGRPIMRLKRRMPRLKQEQPWALLLPATRQHFASVHALLRRQKLRFCLHAIKAANQRAQLLIFYPSASTRQGRCPVKDRPK